MARPKFNQHQIEEAFWKKVKRARADTCWLWTGWIQKQPKASGGGYGKFCAGHSTYWLAHRFAWTVVKGPIPKGMLVCHRCDNRRCCNPRHMFLGTHKDNAQDSIKKGRWLSGDRHPSSKVTMAQCEEIRKRYVPWHGVGKLASEFAITGRYLWSIAHGKARVI